MEDELTVEQFEQVRMAADDAATAAYNQGMLETRREELAFQRAKQAWQEVMDKAGLTGMYEGQYTMPVQQWQAQTFGTWGAPTAGQQTQAAQQQAWQQAFEQAGQFGQWYAPGSAPTQGQQTLGAQEQAYTQWLRAAQEARANQALQQQTAQNYLNLLSQLRGPADWAKYQQVLGATPNGMRDLAAAAMGQYIPGGGATTGVSPQAATLQTLQQQVGGFGNAPGQQPAGTNQAQNALGGGTNAMGATQPQAGQPGMGQAPQNQMNLPAPNQIAPQTWANLAPSQQELIKGEYEAQGWYKPDVEAMFAQSLPKYAANAPTAGTFRLR